MGSLIIVLFGINEVLTLYGRSNRKDRFSFGLNVNCYVVMLNIIKIRGWLCSYISLRFFFLTKKRSWTELSPSSIHIYWIFWSVPCFTSHWPADITSSYCMEYTVVYPWPYMTVESCFKFNCCATSTLTTIIIESWR